jgi:hypothetical protein
MVTFLPYNDLSHDDHCALLSIRNAPEITQYTQQKNDINLEDHYQWLKGLKGNEKCYYWAVKGENRVIGGVHITCLETPLPMWGIFFEPLTPPLTTSLVAIYFIDTVFEHLQLATLGSLVHHKNTLALKFNERLGFTPTPSEDGSDFCLMSLTIEGWRERKKGKILAPLVQKLQTTSLQEIPWKR